jgi:hypothetical protein
MKYNMLSLLCMVSGFTISFPHMVINASAYHLDCHRIVLWNSGLWLCGFLSNPTSEFCVDSLLFSMAPVVRIEPNGIQTLLLYDNTRDDLERNSCCLFIEKFKGFNLRVAQEFALTFDGCREKIGVVQLEVTEEFLSQAMGLPAAGKKWFKNAKVEEVPWSLMFTSWKITSCDRGMHVSSLKT